MNEPLDWAAGAAAALGNLGFTLLNSDHPAAPAGSQLLVALRDQPTLRHFDPERLVAWVAAADRGRPITVDRATTAGERTILWGHVHVVDRLPVENRFLTFGGSLRITDIDPALRVVRHDSPGPIVRWGGHSQGLDDLAGEIGAFFGRLIVPVDFVPGAEARLAAEPPGHLYAAFIRDAQARRRGLVPGGSASLDAWLRAEHARILRDHPGWWDVGSTLLDAIGLGQEGFGPMR